MEINTAQDLKDKLMKSTEKMRVFNNKLKDEKIKRQLANEIASDNSGYSSISNGSTTPLDRTTPFR